MHRTSTRLVAGVLVAISAASTAQVSGAAPPAARVPPEIVVEQGHKPFITAHAVGVQRYTCTSAAGGYAWSGPTPRALLYNDHGAVIADHFGGPTWRAKDGSTVVASRVRGVTVDPTAIPWLLLKRDSAVAGPDGDRLAGTTFIQRVATTGGLPPAADECNAAGAGSAREIPYTADYVFWKERF
jgi:hypothetical protein